MLVRRAVATGEGAHGLYPSRDGNDPYFGESAYGVWAASERYFGIPPRRLSPAQASLLAGLIQAPALYDPFRHPGPARARQAEVLRSLVRNRLLAVAQAVGTLAQPLRLRTGVTCHPSAASSSRPGRRSSGGS
jgi:membrane peptidoglycan carboxypeptidase